MKKAYCAEYIVDGVSERPLSGHALVVEAGRIAGLAPLAELGSDTELIDLGDCTLLPGLIDSHVHLVDDGSPRPRGLVETESRGMTLLRAAQRAQDSLCAGVTALRDMGAPTGVIPTLRDAARAEVTVSPTIVSCDTQLTITGGYGRRENVLGREVDGAQDMRRTVRQLFKDGADFVKLMASGQVSNAGAGLEACQFTQEEMEAAVDEAHRLGRAVAVHAVGLKSIESSVAAGVDCIEHGNFMTEELAARMAERGIFFVPTLLPY
ncbi:MAG: amidohydrolase family protein, partial [Burkholderiaceae bacterium]